MLRRSKPYIFLTLLLTSPVHAGNFSVHFHSIPFYENNCTDADTVCNALSVRGDFKNNTYFWKFVPYGASSISENDFTFHAFPNGYCDVTDKKTCQITFGTPFIIEDTFAEGRETFALEIYNGSGELVIQIKDKTLAIVDH